MSLRTGSTAGAVAGRRARRGARRGRGALALALALVAVDARADDEAPPAGPPPELRFGSGSKGGGFDKLALALAEGVKATGGDVTLEVRNTKGSCENIRLLLSGELDFALVQYDVAAEASKASQGRSEGGGGGKGGWMCRITSELADDADLYLVAALSDGAVHMLVRRPVRIDSFDAIGDAPIYLGKDGSGSFETAKVLVGAAGRTIESLNLLEGGSSDAIEALHRQELLMMLRTTERGDPDIADVVASGLASINPLPEDVLNRLIDGYPYYRICPIEPKTYPGLEYAVPTVCVSTVLLAAVPRTGDPGAAARIEAGVAAFLDALDQITRDRAHPELGLDVRSHGFAEKEPILLHPIADERERAQLREWIAKIAGGLVVLALLGVFGRRALRRRGYLRNPWTAGLEGHLSNPLVPFAGFAVIVALSTLVVWLIEHDSNARLRTLNDSFWEMNTFATGNFSTDTLKSSTARFVGAVATIMGLGALAWFTAALTNIFAQDQTRLFQRLRGHLVILNFREDMLQLIRLLRSPGPSQHKAIHVMVPEALPKRVRLQLARVKSLTIHQENPEVPDNLVGLRLHKASRVIVLEGEATSSGEVFHPLRIARAVYQAANLAGHGGDPLASPAAGRPALAGHHLSGPPPAALPRTLVETSEDDPEALFAPFKEWLVAINARQLTHTWLVRAASDPHFADFFTGVVSFRDDNAEVYAAAPPPWLVGRPWGVLRRTLYAQDEPAGVLPIGLYRREHEADEAGRLLINPELDAVVQAHDFVLALCEDQNDLLRALKRSRKIAADEEARWRAGRSATDLRRRA
ncbi:MAG: TAXI family TRAP transporter solute-binding subunit [Nannocystaceae bacterium]